MNEKDLMLYEQIKGELGDPPLSGPVVIDVKTTQFVRLELVLLKALIGDGRPGLFISVDRPHQYMVHLLTMHQIEHCNITFVDAVSRFSADRKQAKGQCGFPSWTEEHRYLARGPEGMVLRRQRTEL